jgi:hypothetical protein
MDLIIGAYAIFSSLLLRVPLWRKYFPQFHVLVCSQSAFFPECDRLCFVSMQITGKIISLYIF